MSDKKRISKPSTQKKISIKRGLISLKKGIKSLYSSRIYYVRHSNVQKQGKHKKVLGKILQMMIRYAFLYSMFMEKFSSNRYPTKAIFNAF